MKHIPSAWAARLGVASTCAALALGTLAAPARADDPSWVFAGFVQDITVGLPGAPGKAFQLDAAAHNAVNTRVRVDLSGITGVATAEFPKDCTTTGDIVTCPAGHGARSFESDPFPVVFHAAPGAAAGASGTVSVTAVADNAAPAGQPSKVTIADGVDVVASSLDGGPLADARPGDTRYSEFGWFNLGNRTAHGQTVVFDTDNGLVPFQYEGCDTRVVGRQHEVTCTVQADLKPGRDNGYEWVTVDKATGKETPGFGTTVGPDALGGKGIDFFVAAASPAPAQLRHAKPARSGPATKSFKLVPVHRIVRPKAKSGGTEIDNSDNYGFSYYRVRNSSDIATLGASASGKVGDVRPVTIGVHNNGRGSLDASRSGDPVLDYIFQTPPGTTITSAPKSCESVVEQRDGTQTGTYGAPGGTYYRCRTGITLDAGQTSTVTFQLKITKVIAGATGTVGFYDKYASPPDWFKDDNPANDKANVVVNPSTGGQGGGTGGPTLPITGTQTGLVAGAGAALLAIGGALYLTARRRRTVLVVGRDD